MSLKIERSSWSKPFTLDAVGTNGIVKCAYKGVMVPNTAFADGDASYLSLTLLIYIFIRHERQQF